MAQGNRWRGGYNSNDDNSRWDEDDHGTSDQQKRGAGTRDYYGERYNRDDEYRSKRMRDNEDYRDEDRWRDRASRGSYGVGGRARYDQQSVYDQNRTNERGGAQSYQQDDYGQGDYSRRGEYRSRAQRGDYSHSDYGSHRSSDIGARPRQSSGHELIYGTQIGPGYTAPEGYSGSQGTGYGLEDTGYGHGHFGAEDRTMRRAGTPSEQILGGNWRGTSGSTPDDEDYMSWRRDQLKKLDDDYQAYRRERAKKFGESFEEWRNKRTKAGAGSISTTTDTGDASNKMK